jgi:NADPH:quinone reductase-like Zn-dependent oxidoreductase
MKCYFLGGGNLDSLELGTAEIPTPGRGQVLVRMRAVSLNYRDLMIASGRRPTAKSLVPLSDGAGEVCTVGADVARWKVGDRVAGIFYQSWLAGAMTQADVKSALGGAMDGTLTEYRLFEEDGLVRIPEHLSFEEAATLPCAAVTAWNALYGASPLRLGQTVLILGTGGVSTFALQFAVAAGARVIVISSSDAKLDKAYALGAHDGINYVSHPEWHSEVRRLTGGRGVDHVIEVGGAGTLERSLGAVCFGGAVHLIGVLSSGQINPFGILGSACTVRALLVGSREMFEQMNDVISSKSMRPLIERVFSFANARQAYQELEAAKHMGKVVIRID